MNNFVSNISTQSFIIMNAMLVVLLTTYAQIILRLRLNKINELYGDNTETLKYYFKLSTDIWIISSALSFLLSFVCWSYVLSSKANIAKTYPITVGLTILFVSFANYLLFQDKFTNINVMGVLVITFGIFLILR